MRSFATFDDAKKEIPRDLNELGTKVMAGYQSKALDELDPETFTTKELQNYDYRILRPHPEDLNPTQPWANQEWFDREAGINGEPRNPGTAWEMRREVWEPLLEPDGRFSYTYSERLWRASPLKIIQAMRENPASRQAYISIWDPIDDSGRLGKHRVPCSLGYQLMIRDGKLDITYFMRSSDFATHWDNDCWLALMFQHWAARELDVPPGSFTHIVSSLHAYAKDVAHAF